MALAVSIIPVLGNIDIEPIIAYNRLKIVDNYLCNIKALEMYYVMVYINV